MLVVLDEIEQYVLGVDFEIEESYKMLWLVSSDSQSTKNMDGDDDSEDDGKDMENDDDVAAKVCSLHNSMVPLQWHWPVVQCGRRSTQQISNFTSHLHFDTLPFIGPIMVHN